MSVTRTETRPVTPPPSPEPDDMKAFLIVLRAALLQITRWIEKRYHLEPK